MNPVDDVSQLNQLLSVHQDSLANYLRDAAPWGAKDEAAFEVIREIVASNEHTSERLTGLIIQRGGRPATPHFPMRFTAYNDLSCEFLLRKLTEHQQRDAETIAGIVGGLKDSYAREIAEGALGAAKAHLDSLREAAG